MAENLLSADLSAEEWKTIELAMRYCGKPGTMSKPL
jgi:hypothetical protein